MKTAKKRVHYTDNYLINPQHPITVILIGAGGTGSQVLTCLARLDATLRALDHPGLFVTVYDPDEVSEANIGRQLFSPSEIGLNKAICLISSINNFFGNNWQAAPRLYPSDVNKANRNDAANIFITCTDNVKSRINLATLLQTVNHHTHRDNTTPLYWMDFGNAQTSGQVILGTIHPKIVQPRSGRYKTVAKLPFVTKYVDYNAIRDEDSGPSCSLAEALAKQDLFINSTLAQLGCNILWKMFREGLIEHNGLYLNLNTLKVNPIDI